MKITGKKIGKGQGRCMKQSKRYGIRFLSAAALACVLSAAICPAQAAAEEEPAAVFKDQEEEPGEEKEERKDTETEKAEVPENTEPEEKGFCEIDPVTGISAEAAAGVFPPGTMMVVTPLQSGESYDRLAEVLSAAADRFWICDIRFFAASMPDFSDAQPVWPKGMVKLGIPVPEEYDLSRTVVYHIGTDGSASQADFAAEDGMILIETDQFSLYAVAEKKEIKSDLPSRLEMTDKVSRLDLSGEDVPVRKNAQETPEAPDSEYVSPETGDSADVRRSVVCVSIAGIICAAASGYRRKRSEED